MDLHGGQATPKSDHASLPNSALRGRAGAWNSVTVGIFSPPKSTKAANHGLFSCHIVDYLGLRNAGNVHNADAIDKRAVPAAKTL